MVRAALLCWLVALLAGLRLGLLGRLGGLVACLAAGVVRVFGSVGAVRLDSCLRN